MANENKPSGPGSARRFLLLIGLAVLLRSAVAICAKQAALTSIGGGIRGMVINPWLITEVLILGLQAVTWAAVLRRFPLTFAYPFLGLVFAVNLVAARFLFGEIVNLQHLAGVGIIILGVFLMSTETGRASSSS